MKKTLFLSAILGAALCSSAFAETVTISGTQNNLNLNDAAYAGKDLILNLTGGYFYGNGVNSVFTQNIQVGDGSENQGGIIGNNGWGNLVTFSGKITGSGEIKKTGAGTNLKHAFTGDVTEYTGNITLSAGNSFYLCFGAVNDGAAATTQNSTATAGVSGTGDITFTTGNNNLVYNYASSAGTVYITNAIKKTGGSSKVQFLGGASYVLNNNAVIDELTISGNSSVKYTGTAKMTVTGGSVAAGSVLEGVRSGSGASETSNLVYNAQYGAGAGTLKNVEAQNLQANAETASITLDGVVGWFASGSTQRNLTLTGNGLILTKGYHGSTTTIQKLIGSGNIESRYTGTDTIIIQDATEWTGSFINVGGTANVTFNGNSNATLAGKSNMNVTLQGTDYSSMHIKAYNGTTTKVTVDNASADTVTIYQLIQDPSDKTSNGVMDVIINHANGLTKVSEWATVKSITLQNGSDLQLNNHNVTTLNVTGGASTVTSGGAIGSNAHGITNLNIGENAALTLANVATVSTVTAASGTLTVSKNLTVSGASTIGTLSVSGDSTIMLNNHNVGTLEVTGGSNFLFSNAAVGSANHTMSKVEVADDASLTFGTANTTVGAITLGNNSHLTVGNEGSHKFDLTTTGLTVNGNANINADLVVNGGTMIFANNTTLTMGCAVTIGMGDTVTVELTEEMVATIAGGGRVDLFTSVETATLGSHIVFTGTNGAALDKADVYSLQYDEATKTIYATPEPATATLSLLALAALAARRKRH